jgi:hypothetical protein
MRAHIRFIAVVAVGWSLQACGDNNSVRPSRLGSNIVTLEFDGVVADSCDVISLQVCNRATFGSGVDGGTPVSGSLTFDVKAPVFYHIQQPEFATTSYIGATVEISVGGSRLKDNPKADARLEVNAAATFMQLAVMGSGGFKSGQVAGLPIHFFSLALPLAPSRFPDTSLSLDDELFSQGLRERPASASFTLKYIPNPSFRLPGIEVIATGTVLSGGITSVRRR